MRAVPSWNAGQGLATDAVSVCDRHELDAATDAPQFPDPSGNP
jgi:hypothetical protein